MGGAMLIARAAPRALTNTLESVLERVPIVSGQGIIARSAQWALGSQLGGWIGSLLRTVPQPDLPGMQAVQQELQLPVFHVSETCVVCLEDLAGVQGQRLKVLSCGHTCMCMGCQEMWGQRFAACPMCGIEDVQVVATLQT
eukprot:4832031-Amphidinium_carterae.1